MWTWCRSVAGSFLSGGGGSFGGGVGCRSEGESPTRDRRRAENQTRDAKSHGYQGDQPV